MKFRWVAISAGRWTATSAALRALLQLAQTAVLARLISPDDFGLMALVGSTLVIFALFADVGVGKALVHYDLPPRRVLSSLYWINLAASLALVAIIAALAPLFSRLYGMPELEELLRLASLTLFLSALGDQHKVLAAKELRFAALSRNEIASAIVGTITAVLLAYAGLGVHALVFGSLVTAASSSALALATLATYRPHPEFSWASSRRFLAFGGWLVGDNLINTLRRQADVFVAGLVATPMALGMFSVPRDLCLRLAFLVNPIVGKVSFPVMAKAKGDRERLAALYGHTLRFTAASNFPLFALLAFFAEDFIRVLYGPRWAPAAEYLRVLAIWGLLRSTGNPVGWLLQAAGRPELSFRWNLALLVLIPPLLWLAGVAFGIDGLVTTLLIAQACLVWPAWRWLVRPACGMTFARYVAQFVGALAAAALACLAAWLAVRQVPWTPLRLALGGGLAVSGYWALSLWWNRPWTDAMLELVGWRGAHVPGSHPP